MKRLLIAVTSWNYLRKWAVLGVLIGIVAGFGAIVFITTLEFATHILLEDVGGYSQALPVGEGDEPGDAEFARPWAVPLTVGLGGLISGVLVFRFAPEAEGHGTDAAIDTIHHRPRGIRLRAPVIKLLASAATIGAGGSAGREGPTAQISAGFGSFLARRLQLTPADARIAVTVGVGSGIGAIFRAPLGGAVLGTEILYRDDLEPEALMPSIIASVVGFSIFGAVEGFTPIFGVLRTAQFDHPNQLFYYALLGVAAGVIARVYARSFYGMVHLTRWLPGSPMFKPAIGGVGVGLLGLAFPAALGTGYGVLQEGMVDGMANEALWFVLAIPFVKILATSLSIGSGGSGGIFGPGMVVGGFVGLGMWRMLEAAPGMMDSPAPFMVVGMIACFGSAAHAPLALILMVAEMTGSLALLPPAMLALVVASLVVGNDSIYEGQLSSRADVPVHRARFGLRSLGAVDVRDTMNPPRHTFTTGSAVDDAVRELESRGLPGAPVVDERGRLLGAVDLAALREADAIGDVIDREYPTLVPHDQLDTALDTLASYGAGWLPVVDDHDLLIGTVGMTDVIAGYRHELGQSLRRLSRIGGVTTLVQATVRETSVLVDQAVGDVRLPPGSVVLSLERANQLVFPDADTVIAVGDAVSIVTPRRFEEQLRNMLDEPTRD